MASIISAGTTSGTSLNLSGDTSGVLQLASNGSTTAVTIDTSQNVGIGTSSPANALNVERNGSCSIRAKSTSSSSAAEVYAVNSSGSVVGPSVYGSGVSPYGAWGAGESAFYSNVACTVMSENLLKFAAGGNTERMRIDTSGNVQIGETSGSSKLNITQSSNSDIALRIIYSGTGAFPIEAITSNASYTGAGIRSRVQNLAAGTGYYAFSYYNDNAADYRFLVLGNGNVQNTNNSYGALSDVKLKENIIDATPKLEKLNQVRVVTYNLKESPEQKLLGVVAQELEQIFPSMIEETLDRDAEGNVLDTTTKSVKYSVFVPMLIKAMQEQQAMIQELKAELDATKAEVQALKGVA